MHFVLVVNNFKIAIRKSKEKGINTTKFLVQKNLQTLFYLDPVSYVEKIFSSHIGSGALEEIECSPKIFSEKEWIRFFGCLRDISIYFVRCSGSLRYFIFILPCLETMTERVSIDSLKFEILIDFMFTLYKFACEIKYLYGYDPSVVQHFYEVQDTLQKVINIQCDSEILNDLNNLAYAAFHNGIGRSELTKQKLKRFFEIYGEKTYSDNKSISRIRSIIVGLHFYHMAIALEEDTGDPDDKKKIIDYIIYAHDHIRPVALFEREFEFPFYCQIFLGKLYFTSVGLHLFILHNYYFFNHFYYCILDYIRLVCKDETHSNYIQQMNILHLVSEDLEKTEFCSTLRELTGLYLSCLLGKNRFYCYYCDFACRIYDLYELKDREFNYDSFGFVLQYVIGLIPVLMQRKEYQQVHTMLDRTVFYFKTRITDIKRIAFMTNLLVHCQYDIENVTYERNEFFRTFIFGVWTEFRTSIDLAIANDEVKLYFYFGGIFMADLMHRTKFYKYSKETKECLETLKFKRFDDFEKILNSLLYCKRQKVPGMNIEKIVCQQVKLNVFVAVGGERLYRTIFTCKNKVTEIWKDIFKNFDFDY